MIGRETRVLLRHYLEQGLSKAAVARWVGVSERTVHRWIAAGQLDRELDLVQAGFPVGTHLDAVPAPFAGAVAAPTSFRACHHSIPIVMDRTICVNETPPGSGVLTSAGTPGTRRRGCCPRSIRIRDQAGPLGTSTRGARLDAAQRALPIPTGSGTRQRGKEQHARPVFQPRATALIAYLKGREKALEAFGWTGRRAEWIALACLHSGVFTRVQWTSFLGCHPEKVRRAVRALVAQDLAVEDAPAGASSTRLDSRWLDL